MKFTSGRSALPFSAAVAGVALLIASGWPRPAVAADFSVSPVIAELGQGALSETITVTNHATSRLRVAVKLMQWSQDATGQDVYSPTDDLVYFPRQMELAGDSKRLIRVGVKVPGALTERAYRLFIEEEPDPVASNGTAQVSLYFRFGVPIFVRPAVPKPQPDVLEPTLAKGKLSLTVKNSGNQHFRLVKIGIADGHGFSRDIQGWYSLAGSTRTYSADIPAEVCRKATILNVSVQGEADSGIAIERKLNVDRENCH